MAGAVNEAIIKLGITYFYFVFAIVTLAKKKKNKNKPPVMMRVTEGEYQQLSSDTQDKAEINIISLNVVRLLCFTDWSRFEILFTRVCVFFIYLERRTEMFTDDWSRICQLQLHQLHCWKRGHRSVIEFNQSQLYYSLLYIILVYIYDHLPVLWVIKTILK